MLPQVETLRTGLDEARRRLGQEPRSLQQQWRRSVMLGDTVRLLRDVKSVIDAPQRVQRLELAKARRPAASAGAPRWCHSDLTL